MSGLSRFFCSLLLLGLAPLPATHADDAAAVPHGGDDEPDVAVVSQTDPAFEQYVDAELIRDAIVSRDPAALTDVALQLHAGEQALLRPHRALCAAAACQLAIRLAAETGDQATLERLRKVVPLLNDSQLSSQLDAAGALTAQSRSVGIPADRLAGLSEEAQGSVLVFLDQIAAVRLTGTHADLDAIAAAVKVDAAISDPMRADLQRIIDEARPATAESATVEQAALDAIRGESRSLTGGLGTYRIDYKIVNKSGGSVSFSLHGSGKSYTLSNNASGNYFATQKWENRPYMMLKGTKYWLKDGTFYIRKSGSKYTFGT